MVNILSAHHRSRVQDPVGTIGLLSTEIPADYHHSSTIALNVRWPVCVEGRGWISRSGLTQNIKMDICVFQCDVPHQWIAASTATGRPRVWILWRGGVSCPVSAAWHSCVAAHWSKYHCYKQAPSRYDLRCLKAPLNPNKQKTKQTFYRADCVKQSKF